MSKRVRIGVVGTSWWADLLYLPSLTSHPQADVVALCGRDGERAGAGAHIWRAPGLWRLPEMIAQAGLDALVVSTPDDLHPPDRHASAGRRPACALR